MDRCSVGLVKPDKRGCISHDDDNSVFLETLSHCIFLCETSVYSYIWGFTEIGIVFNYIFNVLILKQAPLETTCYGYTHIYSLTFQLS